MQTPARWPCLAPVSFVLVPMTVCPKFAAPLGSCPFLVGLIWDEPTIMIINPLHASAVAVEERLLWASFRSTP